MTEVARADIGVGINDAEAIAGIRNLDREFDRAMHHVDGKRAEAIISADLKPLKAKLKEAEAEVKAWEARRKKQGDALSKSEAASYGWSKRRLAAAQREAAVHQDILNQLKDENKQIALNDRASRALEASNKRRVRDADKLAQIAAKEAENERLRWLNQYKGQEMVAKKQKEYAREVERVERLQKRKKGLIRGTETRVVVEVDEQHALAKMYRLKEELRLLGAKPPVKIRVDTDRRDVGILRRRLFALQQSAAGVVEKLSSIGHVRLSLGPFSGTLRTMTIAVAALSPIISSTVLSLSSLVGVLGAGIAGAAAVGAGALTGLGMGFLGLKFATRNAGQEIANARTAINALQKAQEKYGKNSDKAKAKQKELNNTLKAISPLARETALGVEKFYKTFDKFSGPTRKNLGGIAKDGFSALNKLTPMWAKRTNQMSGILRDNLSKGFDFLSHGEGKNKLNSIFGNFNRALPAALHGLGEFGHAFLNFGREGSKFLPMVARGIDNLGGKLLAFTQRDDFGSKVKEWVNDARDLMRFFGAAGRVTMHFFGDGAKSGDRFVNTMTTALNRWDDFLSSDPGKSRMAGMFNEAVDSTISLSHALGPLLKSFSEWSTALAPITQGILDIISVISRLIGAMTHVVAMRGAFVALGAAIGLAWSIGKIVPFINMMIRVVQILKAARDAEIAFAAANAGAGLLGRGKAALAGATEAVAAQKAAQAAGGAAAGAAGAAGAASAAGAAAKAEGAWVGITEAEVAAGAAGTEAGAAGAAGAGMMATAAVVAVPAIVALGAAYLIVKHNVDQHEKSVRALTKSDDKMNAGIEQQTAAEKDAVKSHKRYAAAIGTIKDAQKDLTNLRKQGKSNTDAMIDAEARLFRATERRNAARADFVTASAQETAGVKAQRSAQEELINTRRKELLQAKANAALHGNDADSMAKVAFATKRLQDEMNILRGVEAKATTASLNHQRALKGVGPIAQSAALAVGMFAQKFGKIPNVKKILLSANTSQLSKITSLSKQVDKSVGSRATKNILVNAKSADDAIKKMEAIQAFRLHNKVLPVNAPNAGKLMTQLAKIEGIKLSPKTQQALLKGDQDVIRRLAKILGYKLAPKSVSISLRGYDTAASALNHINSLLAQMHDKSITLTTREVHVLETQRQNTQKTSHLTRATGGPVATQSRSQKITRPKYMVGEEAPRHPEFVIATNPAYRKNNVEYWMRAARALGIPGYAQGGAIASKHKKKVPKPPKGTPPYLHGFGFTPGVNNNPYAAGPDAPKVGGFGYGANLTPSAAPKTKPKALTKKQKKKIGKSKKRIKLATNDPWGQHVKSLLAQQSDLEREVSIRENEQMPEPESFLRDTGQKDVNGDPVMEINPDLVQQFKDSFKPIIDVRNALVAVIADIVQSIPMALTSLGNRKFQAAHNASVLRGQIKNTEDRIKAKQVAKGRLGSSKKNSGKRAAIDKEIDKLRSKEKGYKKSLATEVTRVNNAQEDINTFKGQQKESGFDYREAVNERNAVVAEQGGVDKTASTQLSDSLPTPDKSGGSTTSDALTYGQQSAAADAERMNALRDYGSNFQTSGSLYGDNVNPGSQSFGGGQGIQSNPASLGGVNTTNAVANALGGSTGMSSGDTSGGSVMSSLSGGAQASRVMAPTGSTSGTPTGTSTTDSSTSVNVVNNFQTQPADPHTWSQGLAFELAAAV